jgi:hypothetical protein
MQIVEQMCVYTFCSTDKSHLERSLVVGIASSSAEEEPQRYDWSQ